VTPGEVPAGAGVSYHGWDGRVAVVTGGSSGFGLAIAQALLATGATVEVWDLQAPPDLALGFRRLDVSDEAAVSAGIAAVVAQTGRLDILVNNAGIPGPVAACQDYPLDAWHRVMGINLDGVFYCCRAAIPVMVRAGHGRIVNISSMAGKEGTINNMAYVAAKAGVIGMTKALGKELAKTGVIVNAIAPAVFDTPFAREVEARDPEFVGKLRALIPMGRIGRVEELAALVLWLASSQCSFTTGFTFDLSGGRATY
jgi:3-oxoacyl-[acyl-carrier protein] reductase